MKVLTLALFVALALQEPPEYPQYVYCSPHGIVSAGVVIDPDHPCHCARMNSSDDCDDPKMDTHDSHCNQWCHEDHCSCPIKCIRAEYKTVSPLRATFPEGNTGGGNRRAPSS